MAFIFPFHHAKERNLETPLSLTPLSLQITSNDNVLSLKHMLKLIFNIKYIK